jgi:hypothetical protein
MFNLTRGVLKQIKARGFINGQSITENVSSNSKVLLRNYEFPVMVKVTKIRYHKEVSAVVLKLFDGEDYLDCCLDSLCWSNINQLDFKKFFDKENIEPVPDNKCIKLGSVIIISEYTFTDIYLEEKVKTEDMFHLLKYACIGWDYTCIDEESNDNSKSSQYKIETLSPNLNNIRWHVKAKLLKVSLVKDFQNKNTGQDGQFIRLQFSDESGIVELVAFNAEIDKVKSLIENRVYKISNADVKISKGAVNAFQETSNSKIELVVNKRTTVIESLCDEKLFKIFIKASELEKKEENIVTDHDDKYKEFTKLIDIRQKKEGSLVNIIGVVSREDEITEVTPKFKSPIKLKNFYICDQTSDELKVSLWGKQAETIIVKTGSIFMLNKVKLTNYNGLKGVSVLLESYLTKIEDNWNNISLANDLRKWWAEKNINDLCYSLKRSNTSEDFSNKKPKEEP